MPELTHAERMLRLAEQTAPCPHAKVQAWDVPEGLSACPDCGGTGRVALYPMLRRECPDCHGTTSLIGRHCMVCQGRGWIPNMSLKALVDAAQLVFHHENWYISPNALGWWVYKEGGWIVTSHETLLDALSLALVKAQVK
mgnify:CR=1 FL=1